jgi:hypothetical protein
MLKDSGGQMPTSKISDRIDPSIFCSHILWEQKDTNRLKFSLLMRDEEALESLTDDAWNYALEYDKACREAEERWYPYRAAEIFDDFQVNHYESNEVDSILKKRWSDLRQQVSATYFNGTILPEINQALQRREILQPRYQTDWGFRVKSKGEQIIANALKRYRLINETGAHRQITLLYEPLFRIPDENRVIIPDFVIPEYCLIVEYAGLEERNYKVGLWLKTDAIRKLGFPLVILRPEDLTDVKKSFNQKLCFYFGLCTVEA